MSDIINRRDILADVLCGEDPNLSALPGLQNLVDLANLIDSDGLAELADLTAQAALLLRPPMSASPKEHLVLLPSTGRHRGSPRFTDWPDRPGHHGLRDPETAISGRTVCPDTPGFPDLPDALDQAGLSDFENFPGLPGRPDEPTIPKLKVLSAPPGRPAGRVGADPQASSATRKRTTLSLTPFVAGCLDMAKAEVQMLVPSGCRVTKSALADAALALALRELGSKGKRSRIVRELIRESARIHGRDPVKDHNARRNP